ncbi:Multidrug efflux pump subunit AcrB [Aliiroseovarius sediminilitoris]|uniref:Multidrug efflux pump subunit AcrB n=1 Tax=Aliiroseovarius sediminilitoris TaxID=1173584 RepID=A0A1I0RA81_9RHOB|nr:efflux RND transporter permease subunit [Aliiroseovarius sediminilitoris]SEW37691.1 Multidrug efflux pump subunit AcrB [Aliiroseovarius sediminilitoris]
MKLGISGRLTKAFIRSPLTPLLLLASLAMGLIALAVIPREEEPQISVPMVDVMLRTDGLHAPDAVELVTEPLEAILGSINAVEHVYSQTADDSVMVTARFDVGTDPDDAILRVNERIMANMDRIPQGISQPLIVGRGINDVAIVALTLSPRPDAAEYWDDRALYSLVEELRASLMSVEDVGLTYIVGGRTDQIRIEPDPERLALYGVTLQQLAARVGEANQAFPAGTVTTLDRSLTVTAGQTLRGPSDIGLLQLTTRDGRPVYVRDVADIVVGGAPVDARTWTMTRDDPAAAWTRLPAVTLAIAKREGANAVLVAEHVLERLELLRGSLIPEDIAVEVTRNYGQSADEKADELLFHLGLATVSIVLLVTLVIGWREGIVVAIVIPTTILLTLFASNMMGYTINRVSLFALIFSIGILVDDAIVVIENIARHWAMRDGRSRVTAAIEAVAEVGNPTIVATLTVVAALLPMLFVSGLMGPYMGPIPVNASAAMIFSFFVAVILTPWLMLKIAGRGGAEAGGHGHDSEGVLGRLFRRIAAPVIASRWRAGVFLVVVLVLTGGSMTFFFDRTVVVKLLPFDNKSEFQVILDMPEGTSLERTERVLTEAAERLAALPEATSIQLHAGTAAPFNFNGLVRHYYLRKQPELGDLQVNLEEKSHRDRSSHEIALAAREMLADMDLPEGGSIQIAEIPPGPPVLATLLAEIYGPDADTRRAVAREVREAFAAVPYVVDVEDSFGQPRPRLRLAIDQDSLEYFNVLQSDVYDTIRVLFDGMPVGYSHRGEGRDPTEIRVALPRGELSWSERLASTPVPANLLPGDRGVVELGDLVTVTEEAGNYPIFRHNGRFAEMVMAEMAGDFEAPIYGMIAVQNALDDRPWSAEVPKPEISLYGQPDSDATPTLLWDGEWEVTYVTFRDMGAAFGVAILAIYVLVVAQFGSFRVPLIILTPIPLTFIGIVFGHWVFDAAFTATSMIGFIALAGIIVRNSILLVDFIRHGAEGDEPLRETLLRAGAIRFKPILLTAIAAMIGASVILTDPIFQGLAISLLFGLASSTLLTVLVIPAIYVLFKKADQPYRPAIVSEDD